MKYEVDRSFPMRRDEFVFTSYRVLKMVEGRGNLSYGYEFPNSAISILWKCWCVKMLSWKVKTWLVKCVIICSAVDGICDGVDVGRILRSTFDETLSNCCCNLYRAFGWLIYMCEGCLMVIGLIENVCGSIGCLVQGRAWAIGFLVIVIAKRWLDRSVRIEMCDIKDAVLVLPVVDWVKYCVSIR